MATVIDQHPTQCGASQGSLGGGRGSAQAYLSTGTLHVAAAAPDVAHGLASYQETFSIFASAPSNAIFRISAHGSVTGEGIAGIFLGLDGLGIGSALFGFNMDQTQTYFLYNSGFTGAPWANPAPGVWETPASLTAATSTFVIVMSASAQACCGGSVDFGNTFGFDIVLPAGATLTSESGVFLTQVPAPVPLPPALPLMAGAVAGLGLWRRLGRSHRIEHPA